MILRLNEVQDYQDTSKIHANVSTYRNGGAVLKKQFILIILITIVILPGCSYFEGSNLQNVGMLFDTTIDSNTWSEEGYQSLMEIEQEFDIDVFYKENIRTEKEVLRAVDELVQEGVNLIIGHSNIFGNYFVDITETYPDVHFVYTNGAIYNPSVTSLNFNTHAIGFFSGMVAGEMSEKQDIGVIAVYSWQQELEGFYEGVKYQNPSANIRIDFVNDWEDEDQALKLYEAFKNAGIDIILPVGNAFSEAVIERAAEDKIYSIGYMADQFEIAPDYVLTSMIQHVDELYLDVIQSFNKGDLSGGIQTYDFKDDIISLGTFNEAIPEEFQNEIRDAIEEYKETDLLPNERNDS